MNQFDGAEQSGQQRGSDGNSLKTLKALNTPNAQTAGGDENSAFAQGLPEWSVEPPLVAIRRRRKA